MTGHAPIGTEVLTRAESIALADCEERIERGMKTYVEVGMALGAIRENGLYRYEHETFEAYCAARWGFTGRRGRQLIEAAEIGTIVPVENEGQARALSAVPEPERADVWREAVERTNGKPTAAAVREVHEERTRPTQAPGPADAADCPPVDPGTTSDPDAEHYEAGGWAGDDEPGGCGLECACGVTYGGFDTLAEAREELDRHIETPEPDASAPSGAGSGEAVAPTREDGATAAPDLRGLVLAALPRGEDEALPFSPVFDRIAAGIPGVQVRHVLDVLAVMSEAGMAASKQGSRGWVWWRPEPGEQYKTDPAQRIAAVAEVAPEFVKPVAPEQVVAVEVGRNAADTLVDTVRAEVLAIIAAVDLGEDLITEQLLADLQAAVDLLASRKKASA